MTDITSTPSFRCVIGVEVSDIEDTLSIDITSSDFSEWHKTMSTHYAEYIHHRTREKYWKKFKRKPSMVDMYTANKVIRKNKDDSFEYVKNRETGDLRMLTDEEILWLILTVG